MPAAVTQLVECPAVNRLVTGSSPVGGAFYPFVEYILKIVFKIFSLCFFLA